MIQFISLFLFPFLLQAQNFNHRLSIQGYLKSGGTAIEDSAGYPMRFLIKRNSVTVWCQHSTANIPVIRGVFSAVLSGASDCESLTNTLDASVFQHSAQSDLFIIDVIVDTAKNGFGSADDATFAGIDLVPAPMAMRSYQAEQALTLAQTLPVSSGGTGATTAVAARTNLGLGSIATINTSGNASQVLLGNGTFGVMPAPTQFTGNLSGDVTGTQTATSVVRIRGQNISTTAPTNGQVMTWNQAALEWQAASPTPAPVSTVAGKVGNVQLVSADISDATSANTANRVIIRDASGNFSAGAITASAVTTSTIQSATGRVQLGATGVGFTAMGACTIASAAITTTASNRTCTGVPASTAVAVHCSAAAALTNANTNNIYCRASGTADRLVCNTTVANTVNTTYICMWIRP